MIVRGGFSESRYALAGLLVVFANVAFVGVYLVFHRMVLSGGEATPGDRSRVGRPEQPLMAVAMIVSLTVVLVLGVWIPAPLDRLLHGAVTVIGGRL